MQTVMEPTNEPETTDNRYDNHEIYDPRGHFIGFCTQRKRNWYLEKGIATVTGDRRITLNFESKLRDGNFEVYDVADKMIGYCSRGRAQWYLEHKLAVPLDDRRLKLVSEDAGLKVVRREAQCVVCGGLEAIRKYYVIPSHFKKWFPVARKEHVSNDIVILCEECVPEAEACANDLRAELFEEFGIKEADFLDQRKRRVRLLAGSILRNGVDREIKLALLSKLLAEIGELGPDSLSEERLQALSKIDIVVVRDGARCPAEYIVKKVMERDGLDDFIRRWKDRFVGELAPEYLPDDFHL